MTRPNSCENLGFGLSMPPSENPGKKPPSSSVLPGEIGMVLDLGHRDVNHLDVIQPCQRGDDEAFRVLFESHKDRVYSIALRYAGNSAAAMDIAQDTFLKLLSNIQQFRGEASFDSWLYRLVVNSCLDYHRRRRRFLPLLEHGLDDALDDALDRFRAPRESALHDLRREEQEERVQQVVAQLPEE